MALEQPHRTLGKVTTVFATKLKSFTFVPFLKRLPAENRAWKKVFQTNRAKSSGEPGDREKSMAEERVYKAEVIYVQDPEDGQLGETHKNTPQNETYKIKSTYKALAAIPTNTLLLEQQAIDEEVSKKEALLNPADNYSWEDPHAEMCSPAQLRQQTAELYATIDEVLEDTIQTRQSNHVNKAMVKSLAAEASRASSPFQPSVTAEKTMTKPGVIRPVIITSRFTEDQDEEFHPNPFKIHQGSKSNRYQYKFVSGGLCAGTPADAPADSHPQPSETQEDYKSRLASTQEVPSAVNTLETHI